MRRDKQVEEQIVNMLRYRALDCSVRERYSALELGDPNTRDLFILSLGLSEDEIRTQLQGLKDLQSDMAIGLFKKTPAKSSKKARLRPRRYHLQYPNLGTSWR